MVNCFWYTFGVSDRGITHYIQNRKVSNLESHWCAWSYCVNQRYCEAPDALRVVLEIVLSLTLSERGCLQWPKVGLSVAIWLINKVWTNFIFCFVLFWFFCCRFQQANIHCGINSISRPISTHDHNSTDQAIAMDKYQTTSENLNISFLENNKLQ